METTETSAKSLAEGLHLFRLGTDMISEYWEELVPYIRRVPALNGGTLSAENTNIVLHNLLREYSVLWLVTDKAARPKAVIIASQMHLTLDGRRALYIDALWSAVPYASDLYTTVIQEIDKYAKLRGFSHVIAHVADPKYATKLVADGHFLRSPATVIWRTVK